MNEPTPARIDPESLLPHQVVVWGANTEGRHGKGLAKTMFGDYPHRIGTVGDRAVYGKAEGYHQGKLGGSYAIVTKDLSQGERSIPIAKIAAAIERFKAFAAANPNREFLVTPIGTGLAGYTAAEIGPYFQDSPANVRLPQEFLEALKPHQPEPDKQLQETLATRYAALTAALLNYHNCTSITGEYYRATWNPETGEIKLYDIGSDRPKIAARYDSTAKQYVATRQQYEPPFLTPTDIDRLEALDAEIKKKLARKATTELN